MACSRPRIPPVSSSTSYMRRAKSFCRCRQRRKNSPMSASPFRRCPRRNSALSFKARSSVGPRMPKLPASSRNNLNRDTAKPMTDHATIGMIGLGLMGASLSARLLEAGHAVIGFDIDIERCQALKARGGEVTASAGELAVRCRTIVVAVYSANQVEAVLAELKRNEKPARSVIICTTTCTPDEILRVAQQADDAGLSLVEAPIAGTSAEVRDGSAMALIAGPQETLDA